MDCYPLDDQPRGKRRQIAAQHTAPLNVDLGTMVPIFGVKVRRVVIVKEHLDHHAKKTANLRHG
jgi:hypothetical protein